MTDEKTLPKSYSADKFVVRLPDGMRNRIAEVAQRYHRSMNSEIVSRLDTSLQIESNKLDNEQETNTSKSPISVTPDEQKIINFYRNLTANQQQALLTLVNTSE